MAHVLGSIAQSEDINYSAFYDANGKKLASSETSMTQTFE